MKIVQGDELEWVRGLEYRGGTFHFRNLMEGTPGTIDNFQLSMGRNDKDFVSPRHRHNFEQFRFQLEGDLNFARDGIMTPGMVGYFPEGTSYGPQTSEGTATTFVLQFGGSSGQGYLSRQEVKQGMEALRATGTFEGGVYRRNEGEPGKRNMDGFQAIWEHVNGRPLQFPKARYDKPVMMDQAGYEWVPSAAQPGVYEKLLGVFTERRSEAGIVLVNAGATLTGSGRGIYLAYREGVVRCRAGNRAPALRIARPARAFGQANLCGGGRRVVRASDNSFSRCHGRAIAVRRTASLRSPIAVRRTAMRGHDVASAVQATRQTAYFARKNVRSA
jgi:hypothetical protein